MTSHQPWYNVFSMLCVCSELTIDVNCWRIFWSVKILQMKRLLLMSIPILWALKRMTALLKFERLKIFCSQQLEYIEALLSFV